MRAVVRGLVIVGSVRGIGVVGGVGIGVRGVGGRVVVASDSLLNLVQHSRHYVYFVG